MTLDLICEAVDVAGQNPLAEHYGDERLEAIRWTCVKAAHDGVISFEIARAVFETARAHFRPDLASPTGSQAGASSDDGACAST
jgi:hypothetical protein